MTKKQILYLTLLLLCTPFTFVNLPQPIINVQFERQDESSLAKSTIRTAHIPLREEGVSIPENIPQDWWAAVQESIVATEYEINWHKEKQVYSSANRAQNLRFDYSENGFKVTPRLERTWSVKMTLASYGKEEMTPFKNGNFSPNKNKAQSESGAVTITYENTQEGMRQNFLVKEKPDGTGKLRLNLDVDSGLDFSVLPDKQGIGFDDVNGFRQYEYTGLKVTDAAGVELSAAMQKDGDNLSILVNDNGAKYPILIDPLSISPNWTAVGDQALAWFGRCVSFAGDVNGDNYADVIVGAWQYDNGEVDEGRAYVYHGSASGLSNTPAWTAEGNQASAFFGRSVDFAGDVNGDTYADVIVGSADYDNGANADAGRAYVYHGSASGLSATASWTAQCNQAGAFFGKRVASAGDVNGDNYDDVIVGAHQYDNGQVNEGAVFVFYGSSTGLVGTTQTAAAWTAESNLANAEFGISVTTAGDVNNDGFSDVIVGSWQFNGGQLDEGRVYVYHGSGSGLSLAANWTAESNQAGAKLGINVSPAGDVNGDNVDDVIVSAYNYDNLFTDEGRVYVYYGNVGTGLSATAAWTADGGQASANFGRSAAFGDFNADGFSDVVVGCPNYDNGETDEGRAYVYKGSASGLSATPDWTAESNQAGAFFGYSVSFSDIVKSVNGDNYSDIIIGAYGYNGAGAAFVYHGPGVAPIITSFAPASGPVGTSVTITGANFNPIPANNVVIFGATAATVTTASATQLTVTVPTGATYAPITVLNTATGLLAYSMSNFTPTFTPSKGSITTADFSPKVDFTTGTQPYSVAIGDLDGDGKADLAVANRSSATVSVFRNTGSSGTISYAAKVDFTTGSGPFSVAIGDLDGDGKADLAVANNSSATVSVLRNTGSSGTISYAAKVDFTTGTQPVSVAIGDLDGDGKADLAVANVSSNTVSVFRNTGSSGTISYAAKVDFTTGTNPYSVAIGDLDGDGKADLAVANNSSTTVSVFRNTGSSGTISYAAKVDFTTGANPLSVAIGDLDGDGKADLAVANQGSATVSVFRNTGSSGTISYAAKVDLTTGSGPFSVAIGDLDGDGKADLAVANLNSTTVSVFRNTGSSGTISYAAKVDFTTGTNPRSVAIGDLDGDGKADLAVANEVSATVSVIRNNPVLPPTITSFTPSSGVVGTSVTITGTNFNTTPANNVVIFGATAATVTAATATQLTVTVPTGATYAPITVLNTATGLLAYSISKFTPTFTPIKGSITTADFEPKLDFNSGAGATSVAIADLDGDGKADLAVTTFGGSGVSVFRNTGSPGAIAYAAKVDFTLPTNSNCIAIGDLDGDGKADLATANFGGGGGTSVSVFRNTGSIGTISFAARLDLTAGTAPAGVAIGDLDGDGKSDLAAANYNSATVSVFRNTGSPGVISYAAKVDFAAGAGANWVDIGDLDGDGKADLAVANQNSATVSVLRNTGSSGTINFAAKVDFTTGSTPVEVASGDLDGDGKADLAVTNNGSNSISIFRNTGSSGTISFAVKVDFATGPGAAGFDIGDLDGDGKADLAVTNSSGGSGNTVSVFRNGGSPGTIAYAAKVDLTTSTGPNGVAIGDLDGDGKADLAIANVGGSNVSVIRNNPAFIPVITAVSIPNVSMKIGDVVTATITVSSNTEAFTLGTSSIGGFTLGSLIKSNNTTYTAQFTITAGGTDVAAGSSIPLSVILTGVAGSNAPFTTAISQAADPIDANGPTATINQSGGQTDPASISPVSFTIVFNQAINPSTFTNADITLGGTASGQSVSSLTTSDNITWTASIAATGSGTISPGISAAVVQDPSGNNNASSTSTDNTVTFNNTIGTTIITLSSSGSYTVPAGINSITVEAWGGGSGGSGGGNGGAGVGSGGGGGAYSKGAVSVVPGNSYPYQIGIGGIGGLQSGGGGSFGSGGNDTFFNSVLTLMAKGGTPGNPGTGGLSSSGVGTVKFSGGSGGSGASGGGAGGGGGGGSSAGTSADGTLGVTASTGTGAAGGTGPAGGGNGGKGGDSGIQNASSGSVPGGGGGGGSNAGGGSGGFGANGQIIITYTQPTVISVTSSTTNGTYGIGQIISVQVLFSENVTVTNFPQLTLETGTIDRVVNYTSGTGTPTLTFAYTVQSGDVSADLEVLSTSALALNGGTVKNASGNDAILTLPALGGGNSLGGSKAIVIDGVVPTVTNVTSSTVDGTYGLGSVIAVNVTFSKVVNVVGTPTITLETGTTDRTANYASGSGTNTLTFNYSVQSGDISSDLDYVAGSLFAPSLTEGFESGTLNPIISFQTVGTFNSAPGLKNITSFGSTKAFGFGRSTCAASCFLNFTSTLTVTFPSPTFVNAINWSEMEILSNWGSQGQIYLDGVALSGAIMGGVPVNSNVADASPRYLAYSVNQTVTTISLLVVDITNASEITIDDFQITAGTSIKDVALNNATLTLPTPGASGSLSFNKNIVISTPPPTITSFSPTGGPIGTSVTITGTNFNATPANNIVIFGATAATVTAATATQLTVTVPTGAIYSPITVLNTATGLLAYSKSNFTPTFTPNKGSITTNDFEPKVDLTSGSGPWSVAVGDLDGDGKADLAVANSASNTVSVFRNTGSSGAVSYAAKVDLATGLAPYSVAIGDIDGDGKSDLAVANYNSNTVSVFRNTGTPGIISYAAKVDFTTGIAPWAAAIGDLDGDGRADIAISNYSSSSVSVFRNTGSPGTINYAARADFTTGGAPYSCAIGDMDGDGKTDLAVANYNSNTVSVFLNTGSPGIINYAARVDFPTGTNPLSVAVGDLDGDGKSDLAVANQNSNTVSVFRNTGSPGTLSYAVKVDFTTTGLARSVAIGDLDGDGKADLAVANQESSATVSVFRNTGTPGTISYAARVDFTTGAVPYSVAIGDLDGDGKTDLAVANWVGNTVSVIRNNPVFPPTITSFTPTSGAVGTSVTITGTNFNTTPANNIVFFGATKATVNAASATSLTVTVPSGATYQPITVLVGGLLAYSSTPFIATFNGGAINTNTFYPRVDYTVTGVSQDPVSVVIVDLDSDGKSDLVVNGFLSNIVSVFRNTSPNAGTISYAAKVDFATGTSPRLMTSGDLDGDGKPDLVIANSSGSVTVLRNTSSGSGNISFASKLDILVGSNPESVQIGDLDNDGRADLAVANAGSNFVSVLRSTSSGAGNISFATSIDFTTGAKVMSVGIGDLDDDGKADLAVVNQTPATISLLRNTSPGAGSITFAAKVDYSTGANPRSVALGDLDGDGKKDMAVANDLGGSLSVYRNTSNAGTISFTNQVEYPTGFRPLSVAIGDLDGDGKADLAASNYSSVNVSVLKNASSGPGAIVLNAKVDYATGYAHGVSIGDLDNDGKPDLVTANHNEGSITLLQNGPFTGFVTTWKTTTPGESITIPTTGSGYDYYVNWGDGQADFGVTGDATHNYSVAGTYTVSISGTFPRIFFNNGGDKSKILSIEQWGDIIWSSMGGSFYGCNNLTINASDAPDLALVTDVNNMFSFTNSLAATLNNWDVSNVTNMSYMFLYSSFNGDISAWDVSSVITMRDMFNNNTVFNGDISGWNLASLNEMSFMFNGATSFNGDISNWNVSSVTAMDGAFASTAVFNADVTNWDVSNVVNMAGTFDNAASFNQDLSNWNVGNVTFMVNMLSNSGLSQANYDALLAGWSAQTLQPNITLGADGLTYCNKAARDILTSAPNNWTITDAGQSAACPLITSVSSSTADGPYGIGSVISITVLFNKVVNVVGTPTITLETGTTDQVVNYTSGNGTNTLTFDYMVQIGDVSADLDYLSTTALALNAGTIKDVTNNDAILTLAAPAAAGSLGANKAIVIDGVVPIAPSIPDLDVSDDIGLSTTDNITSLDANLTLTGTAESGALITFTESGLGVLGTATATGGNYSFDFDIASGTYTITATAQDAAGNNSIASGSLTLTVDTGNPTVTVNQSVSQADPSNTVPVSFDLVFNKTVNPSTFISTDITLGGTATGQSVSSLSTSDNINWILTITAAGAGTIIPSIAPGVLEDVPGNTNTASSNTDNSVTYCTIIAPVVGTITQPTCTTPTGSVALSGLPAGAWTINPGTIAGSGTTTTLTLLAPSTTFNYTVTETATGCLSVASANVVINAVPAAPVAPIVGTITQPTCTTPTGSAALSGLPAGAWTINPGAIAGSGTTTTLTGLAISTTYNFTVTSTVTGCISTASANVVINAVPTTATPIVGIITQPTCIVPTGSVALSGLPAGAWTINPGAIAGSGTTTTLTGLAVSTTYNFTVTSTATGCISTASANVVINAVPTTATPIVGTITQPTCTTPTGSVALSGLPAGAWTINPGAIAGSGTTTTLTGLAVSTTHNYTVTDASTGCISTASANVVINAVPTAATPVVGTITQPTCTTPTGSVALSGLPAGAWTINPGAIAGSGATTTLTLLTPSTTFNYTVTETATGCISTASANVVINAVPVTATPVVGTITQPTCTTPTGSVALSGLPAGAWTINPGAIAGSGATTTLTLLTPSTTFNYTVTETATGCISTASVNVVINAIPASPAAPTATVTTQPTCIVPGTITVTVPANGAGVSYTVTGTSPVVAPQNNATGIFTGLAAGNYDVTTTVNGCLSSATALTVNVAPGAPTAPVVGTITQPTCTTPTGSVALSGLPAGAWTINPGTIAGSGATTTLTLLTPSTTFNYTVTETATGCISSASANVVINAIPTASAPIVGTITQPTCTTPTGSVALSGLPAGAWTINPGAIAGSGATTTLTLLTPSTTFNYTVTETATGCISSASANVVINAVPSATAPIVGTITQPTCTTPTGSVALSGLPSGAWTINPGAIAGSGATTTLTLLTPSTTFNYTVTETATGCISVASANVVINAVPAATAPIVGTITQPTCTVPTGSVALSGLPAGAWTINPGAIAGSGATTTLTLLTPSTTFNYTVTETATGCTSVASANVVINAVPSATAPIVGTITQPTCSVPTGSVALSGLPAGAWTINPGAIAGSGATTTLTLLTPSTTFNYTVTETATGCTSGASTNVVINSVPAGPAAPTATVTTQPTCIAPTGTITVTVPANGAGVSYTVTGTSPVVAGQNNATGIFTGLAAGNYDVTTTVNGCLSSATALTVNVAPGAPTAPVVGTITQPTCTTPTGSVALSGLPAGAWTINPGTIAGSGATTTLTLLTPSTTFNYTVTETATGCISSASANVVINAIPTASAPIVGTITQPTCTTPTGSVALSGLPAGAWTINPGAIAGSGATTTLTGLAVSTTYNFTVTSTATGCISTASANVVINAVPTAATPVVGTITQPTCTTPTGSVALSGLPSGAWTINPGAIAGSGTTTTLTLLTPATTFNYTVTETATGCTSGASANVVINAVPTAATPIVGTITQPTCTTPTGSVALNGLPVGAWTINPGAIAGSGATTTLTGLAVSTTYNFTITSTATGCISTASANVVINAVPTTATPIVGTITQPTCSVPTGSVALSGLPAGAWTINPGAIAGSGTTTTLTGLAASTTYNFTVTSTATGCISTASTNVVINAVPTTATPVVGIITQPTCTVPTGSVALSGLPAGAWTINPGAIAGSGTTTTLTGLAVSTTYNFTITSTATGCISTASVNVVINAVPTTATPVVGIITQPTCTVPTGSVALSGLPAGAWTINPGAIAGSGATTTLTLLTPSTTFNYTVTDASTGCISSASANVVINAVPASPAAPTATVTTQPTCIVPTGTITITVPANGAGVSYTVTGTIPVVAGQNNATGIFTGLAAGNYDVTTTVNGCISSATALTVNVAPGAPTSPVVGTITQPTCTTPTGSVALSGLPAGAWTINPGAIAGSGTTTTLTGLAVSTTYNFTITSTATGCISTASTNVVINAVPTTATPVVGIITQPTCTVPTGSVALSGLPAGAWTINPGAIAGSGTTTTLTGLAVSTTYNFTVTSTATGCISTASANVVINAVPTAATPVVGTITQPTCTTPTGSVALSGLPSGAWTINPGAIAGSGATTTLTLLTPSTTFNYTVTETATGCISVASANVVVNSVPVAPAAPTASVTTQPTCSVASGTITVTVPANGAGVSYTVTGTSPVVAAQTNAIGIFSGLAAGNYNVTTTVNGCTSAATALTINGQPATPASPTASVTTQPTCSVATGTITVTIPANGTGVSYTVTGTSPVVAAQSNATGIFTGLATGNYNVTTTVNGCTSTATALTVNPQPATPAAPTASVTAQPTCSLATGTITVTVPANGAGVSYTVTGTSPVVAAQNNATGIFAGLSTGNYNVTTTVSGCTSTATALTINAQPTVPSAPAATVTSQPTCTLSTGTITVTVPANGTGVSYTVTGTNPVVAAQSNATGIFSGLATGNYNVTTTVSGCTSTATALTINTQPTVPSAPAATVTSQPTCILSTGTITVTVPANGTGVSYTVTGTNPVVAAQSNATGIFSGLATGNYNVTAAVSGCTSTATTLIINPIPNPPVLSIASVLIVNTAVGSSNGSIDVTGAVSGGGGNYSYQWYAGSGVSTPITGAVNATITNLAAGGYTVVATDLVSGCATTPQTFTIKTISLPTVISIKYQTPVTSPTNATGLTFRVTFSENVVNVDAADFTKIVTGVSTGGTVVTAVTGAIYDVTFPVAGNGTVRVDVLSTASIANVGGSAYASNFTTGQVYVIDQTPPVFSSTAPTSNSTVNNSQVSYTLSEALTSGTITWTRTGGAPDGASPHAQTLIGGELTVGPHPNITLTNSPALVPGVFYSVTFSGIDLAGNSSAPAVETNVTFTPLAGNLSDIAVSSSFSYPQNINYALFQEAGDIQNSSTSLSVAKFDIRDGGASGNDTDPFPTILTGMTIDLGSNFSLIRRIALYNGAGDTELAGTDKDVSSQKISFSDLSISSNDNASTSFTIRVSFVQKVTDNQQFSFTITAVTAQAGNSGFASANAGGAASSTSNNNNRIEVIGSKLNFVQEPSNTIVNEVMTPAVTMEAVDANGNLDLDFSGSVKLISLGSLSSNPTISMTSGVGTSSDILFSEAGTALTLTTTNGFSLTNATSAPFDIYDDTEGIELVINSFITPNAADDQNNVLYIENIEFFPENTVKLIDRWGVPIKSWTNFSNYGSSDPEQADFDFTSLNIGNYICIVEYKNSTGGDKKSQTQMISVLK